MIFHGVYTTPQVLDSTLSTTSNNAVNGQAVAEYVQTQLENVGGGCPIFREDVMDGSNMFEINRSQAIILGKTVKLYFEFKTKGETSATGNDSLVGTLKSDIPSLDYDVDVIFDNETLRLSGVELRFIRSPWGENLWLGQGFRGRIEWGGNRVVNTIESNTTNITNIPSTSAVVNYVNALEKSGVIIANSPYFTIERSFALIIGHVVRLDMAISIGRDQELTGGTLLIGTLNSTVPKPPESVFWSASSAVYTNSGNLVQMLVESDGRILLKGTTTIYSNGVGMYATISYPFNPV
jgi:hypothetical protein